MTTPDAALQTQIKNLQERSGKTLDQLYALIEKSGLEKHGQIRTHLKESLGMGHGDANTVAALFLKRGQEPSTESDNPLDRLYTGPKAELRPIHEALMKHIEEMGDYEEAPKKAYVSLRRKKQFAMIGPATRTAVEVGLFLGHDFEHGRLKALGPGKMCSHTVRLSEVSEVDDELIGLIRQSHGRAG